MAGITFDNSGYTLTGGSLTLGGGVNTGPYNATINSTIAGLNGLWKRGSGTLTLGGANTFSGYTNITGGTLTLANVNALAGSTLDYNSYGGWLSFGSIDRRDVGGLQGSQSLALTNGSAGVALTRANDSTTTYTPGILSGAGSLKKTGAGELRLLARTPTRAARQWRRHVDGRFHRFQPDQHSPEHHGPHLGRR